MIRHDLMSPTPGTSFRRPNDTDSAEIVLYGSAPRSGGSDRLGRGGGARLSLWNDLQADLGVAFPLSYRAPGQSRAQRAFPVHAVERPEALPGTRRGALSPIVAIRLE